MNQDGDGLEPKCPGGPGTAPGRVLVTEWVQIAPIPMIFGEDCVIFHEDSESGLQMAPKGCKNAKNNKFTRKLPR